MDDKKRFEQIVFTEEQFKDQVGLYHAVAQQLRLLMDAGYIAVVRLDEVGIIVIEYEHNERFDPWGVANPYWLTEDELLTIDYSNESYSKYEEVLCGE